MENYKEERNSLEGIDKAILRLLAQRSEVVGGIGSKKGNAGERVRDGLRERSLMTMLNSEADRLGLSSYHVARIYREIVGYSVSQQEAGMRLADRTESARAAHLGIEGSNTHSAAARHLSAANVPVELKGCNTLRAVFEMVENGEADYGVVPVENTTAGSINEVYDLLYRSSLKIVGEEKLPIEHCLLATSEIALSGIRTVVSHPQALAQCADFLSGLTNCRLQTSCDTATAAKMVADKKDLACAAIASEDAAAVYGLRVIRRGISNQRENYTRFLVVGREPAVYRKGLSYKTSVLLALHHETGSLEKCLRVLSEHGVNMTKLESRPRPHMPWEYMFYVDCEGAVSEERVRKALDEMGKHTSFLKVLGSYPASGSEVRLPVPLPEREDEKETEAACVIIEKKSRRLVDRESIEQKTVVRVGGSVNIGEGFCVIAGPCAVESREQMLETAAAVANIGGNMLRGGVYKPRTSPYSFQGLGEKGLEYLREAGRETGLPTVSEVMKTSQVSQMASSVDMLQVGARNMQNYPLLSALGEVDRPVLLKRGMMASIDELLMAAEYIMVKGNRQVVLCERGIRTFETATRNTLDLSAVVVLKEKTHLPVIVDPSHAVGVARWIAPLAKAALACGADGIMVEVHPNPKEALCDGKQALTPGRFREMMEELRAMEQAQSDRESDISESQYCACSAQSWRPVGW